jgi:hypothetical protein
MGGGNTVEHHRTTLAHNANVTSFFFELSNSSFLGALTGIDETGWDFDDYFVDRWSILLLQNDFGTYFLLISIMILKDRGKAVPLGFSRIATMPTPSISESLGLVGRSACSHVRSLPRGSVYVVLRKRN